MAITGVTAGNNDLSIALWYKPTSQPGSGVKHSLFWLGTGSATRDAVGLAYFNDSGTYKLTFLAEGDNVSNNQTLTNDTWYHLGVTYNAASHIVTFYVNGNNIGTAILAGDLAISATGLQIIVGSDIDGNECIGEIDDVRYWENIIIGVMDWIYNEGAGKIESISEYTPISTGNNLFFGTNF
jgi:hypothetical protein